jgi:hypothetical protein
MLTDGAAAGTGWIADADQVRIGTGLQRVELKQGERRSGAKVGHDMWQFALFCFGSPIAWGTPDGSHFTTQRTNGIMLRSVPFVKSRRRFHFKYPEIAILCRHIG